MAYLCWRDETGAAERMNLNQNRNIRLFGAGEASDRIQLGTTTIALASGVVGPDRIVPASVTPNEGSVLVSEASTASVTTTAGRRPVVSFEGVREALNYGLSLPCDPTDVGLPANVVESLLVGSFVARNHDFAGNFCEGLGGETSGYSYI